MFSKKMCPVFVFALAFLALLSPGSSQVVDCIVAEVNNQIITLTDIRILRAFAINTGGTGGAPPESLREILEGAVSQKVVISLVRENITVTAEEVGRRLNETLEQLAPEARQRTLAEFGLGENDLRPYLEENILYQKIIGLRFSQSANISLREIETYYNENYVPSEKALGREPMPMIQVLDELEALLKKEKVAGQVDSWITSLRDQADIRINDNCFEQAK
jgi:hypothetical protein